MHVLWDTLRARGMPVKGCRIRSGCFPNLCTHSIGHTVAATRGTLNPRYAIQYASHIIVCKHFAITVLTSAGADAEYRPPLQASSDRAVALSKGLYNPSAPIPAEKLPSAEATTAVPLPTGATGEVLPDPTIVDSATIGTVVGEGSGSSSSNGSSGSGGGDGGDVIAAVGNISVGSDLIRQGGGERDPGKETGIDPSAQQQGVVAADGTTALQPPVDSIATVSGGLFCLKALLVG